MDFSNIVIQFLVVCIGSLFKISCFQYFKNKKESSNQSKQVALKVLNDLQNYCFYIIYKYKNHELALKSSEKG